MKNPMTRILHSVVEWIRPARRVQPEPRITPEQLRDALRDMLDDPETRKLALEHFVGSVFPISGGQACKPASEIQGGRHPDISMGSQKHRRDIYCTTGDDGRAGQRWCGLPFVESSQLSFHTIGRRMQVP